MSNNFFDREGVLVDKITKYILEETNEDLNITQRKRIKKLVYNRMVGLISREDFESGLRLSLDEGGVGFSRKPARKLTFYFEKILIQGSETKGHGH
jgi:hypothetical protein